MNSKGVLGSLMALFVSTVILLGLLALFVFGSGAVKKLDNAGSGVRVYEGEVVSLDDVLEGLDNFEKVSRIRYHLQKGLLLEEALEKVYGGNILDEK